MLTVNDGQTTAPPAFPSSFVPALTVVTNETTGSRPLFFGYNTGSNAYASFLTAGACGSYNNMCLDLGNGSTVYSALSNVGSTLDVGGGADGNFTNVQFANTGTTTIGNLTVTGSSLFQDSTNSTTAFQVQNSSAATILSADTTTNKININGNLNLNQVSAPTSAPTLAVTGTGVLNATYYYVYAYVTPSGITNYSPVSASITPASQEVNVTVAASSSSLVTGINIYRTLGNGSSSGPFQLVNSSPLTNTNQTYTDNIADSSLGATASNINHSASLEQNGSTILIADPNNYNTALGIGTLQNNTIGSRNTVTGYQALGSNTTGYFNTASGYYSLQSNTSGYYNTASGAYSLSSNSGGNFNTALGYGSLASNTIGNNNIALGYEAGVTSITANANTTGSNNTFIGYNAGPGTSTQLTNATAIGNDSVVNANNSLVLGSINGVNSASASTNVGIGTTNPQNPLSVSNTAYNTGTAGTAGVSSTTVTGSSTSWTSSLVGDQMVFADGQSANITAVASTTSLTLSSAVTEGTSTPTYVSYEIYAPSLQVTSAGNVGIGTSSPAALLQVGTTGASTIQTGRITFNTDNSASITESYGINVNIPSTSGQAFRVQNGTGDVLYVGENGSIGINTSTPAYNLDVQGTTGARVQTTTNSTSAFQVQNASGTDILNVNTSGSNVTLGSASTPGSLILQDGSGHGISLQSAAQTQSITLTIPADGANTTDTICLQSKGNCSGSGVTTVGALDGGTANANGATISGTSIYLQSASATYPGLVNTTTQTFAGNKTFSNNLTANGAATFADSTNSTLAFQIQNASATSLFNVDTTNSSVEIGIPTAGQMLQLAHSGSDTAIGFQTSGITGGSTLSLVATTGTVTNNTAVGTLAWTNPTYAQALDGSYSTASTTSSSTVTNYLKASNFGFNVPLNSEITGVALNVYRQNTAGASQTPTVFNYTGASQSYTVPAGVSSINVTLYGAQGGAVGSGYSASGLGGETTGTLSVTPGQTLTVIVGGSSTTVGGAGYGGGGSSGGGAVEGGGGGATQIENGSTELAIAGGGGGGGYGAGGAGGGLTGSTSSYGGSGGGGTQSAGGAGGSCPGYYTGGAGSSLIGGGGTAWNGTNPSSGGGGGYYGGGGGGAGNGCDGSGGGGSSLVPSGGTTTGGVQYGNGQAIITPVITTPSITDNTVSLVNNSGVVTGSNLASGAWPTGTSTSTYGGSTNLWGQTLTPTEVNSPSFGAVLAANVANSTAGVDSISMTVYYTLTQTNWSVGDAVSNGLFNISGSTTLATSNYLSITPQGSICIDQSTCNGTEALGVHGAIIASGTITASGSPDYAEDITTSDPTIGAGDIVALDPNNPEQVIKSSGAYDPNIIGAISTSPGYLTNAPSGAINGATNSNQVPLGLVGRIPVKVDTENGPIAIGDYITSSSTPGVGMVATASGQVIGRAMQAYSGSGTGTIIVYLEHFYYNPAISNISSNNTILNSLTVNNTLSATDINVGDLATIATLSVTGNASVAGNLDIGSNLTVIGTTTTANLNITNHLITSGNVPSISVLPAAGTGAICTISGNDTSGSITLVTGTGAWTNGAQCSITFESSYTNAPHPVITPTNTAAAASYTSNAVQPYLTTNTTSMTLNFANADKASNTYTWNYFNSQ